MSCTIREFRLCLVAASTDQAISIDGYNGLLEFSFGQLSKYGNAFINVSLPPQIESYGGIRWDGSYISLADYEHGTIYRLEVTGWLGKIVGFSRFTEGGGVGSFTFAKIVNVPIVIAAQGWPSAAFWIYPDGGLPLRNIPISGQATGVAVSVSR